MSNWSQLNTGVHLLEDINVFNYICRLVEHFNYILFPLYLKNSLTKQPLIVWVWQYFWTLPWNFTVYYLQYSIFVTIPNREQFALQHLSSSSRQNLEIRKISNMHYSDTNYNCIYLKSLQFKVVQNKWSVDLTMILFFF